MKTLRSLSVPLVVAALGSGSLAVAAPAARPVEPPVDATTLKARELVKRGTEEFGKQHWDAARDAYLAAWDLKQHFAIAANLAEVEMQLGRYREAADHWKFALTHLPPDDADRRANAEARLEECRSHLSVVRVSVSVAGAEVRLDGSELGRSPLTDEIWLEPGKHAIQAERAGYLTSSHELVASEGESRDVSLVLQVAPPPRAAEPAPTPPVHHDAPPPAVHTGVETRTVVLIGGGVLALAGVGVGIGYTLDARAASDAASNIGAQLGPADDACTPAPGRTTPTGCAELLRKNDQSRQSENIATAGFVAGGLLGAATVAAVFLWPSDSAKDTARVSVSPWASAESRGVQLVGSF